MSLRKKGLKPETTTTEYVRTKDDVGVKRKLTRTPDMSKPSARVSNDGIIFAPADLEVVEKKEKPVNETVSVTIDRHEKFPLVLIILSVLCAALFSYMLYNYVRINEHTSGVAELRAEIATLSVNVNDLKAKLDKKNDLEYIDKVAREDYGMVSIDEVDKEYIEVDFGDIIVKPEK